jgi:hypothetical protein
VLDWPYACQKENQEEADEVEENCGQEGGSDEEGTLEEVGEEESCCEKGGGED